MAYYYPTEVSASYPKSAGKILTLPTRPITEGIKTSTIVFTADSGHEQRRQKADPKRTFSLKYPILTLDEYRTIRDFFLLVTNVSCFIWVHPVEKTEYQVKFAMDTFSGDNISHGPNGPMYTLNLNLEQVF